jgi:hypothetical protein
MLGFKAGLVLGIVTGIWTIIGLLIVVSCG